MSAYITHVKSYALEHNISYKDAMRKAKSSYVSQASFKAGKSGVASEDTPIVSKAKTTKKKSLQLKTKSKKAYETDSDKEEEEGEEEGEEKQEPGYYSKVRKTKSSKKVEKEVEKPHVVKKPINFEINFQDDDPSINIPPDLGINKMSKRKKPKSKKCFSDSDINEALTNDDILELFNGNA